MNALITLVFDGLAFKSQHHHDVVYICFSQCSNLPAKEAHTANFYEAFRLHGGAVEARACSSCKYDSFHEVIPNSVPDAIDERGLITLLT